MPAADTTGSSASTNMRAPTGDAKAAHARQSALRERLKRTTVAQMAAIALCIGGVCAALAVQQHNAAVDSAQARAMSAALQEALSITMNLRLAFAEAIQGTKLTKRASQRA